MAHRLPPAGVSTAESDIFRFYRVHPPPSKCKPPPQQPDVLMCAVRGDPFLCCPKKPGKSPNTRVLVCSKKIDGCYECVEQDPCTDFSPRPPLTQPGLLQFQRTQCVSRKKCACHMRPKHHQDAIHAQMIQCEQGRDHEPRLLVKIIE